MERKASTNLADTLVYSVQGAKCCLCPVHGVSYGNSTISGLRDNLQIGVNLGENLACNSPSHQEDQNLPTGKEERDEAGFFWHIKLEAGATEDVFYNSF